MGLAVVHGIVSSLKGTITVESSPEVGSTFHVILPTIEEPAEAAEEEQEPLPVGNESVLFVDDEPDIVKMEAQMLSALGYKSTVTSRSLEALGFFEESPNRFDIVITDQVMPGMTGSELAKELLRIRPDLPVILCTGFSSRIDGSVNRCD